MRGLGRRGLYDGGVMRTLLPVVVLGMIASAFGADVSMRDVKTVYVLKMRSGLDQFLASELTKQGVYTVTADPKEADAILTEAIGEPFETKMRELYPPPKPEKTKEELEKEKEGGEKSLASAFDGVWQRPGGSTWGRGRWTLFLVDRKSQAVIWSTHGQPKNMTVEKLADHAERLVRELKKDVGKL
jgi:hypothetical protein